MIPYLTKRFFIVSIALIFIVALGYPFAWLLPIAKGLLVLYGLVIVTDAVMLYAVNSRKQKAERKTTDRFSNGDPNTVSITFCNPYRFSCHVDVIDEMPVEFQMRDFVLSETVKPGEERTVDYKLTPLTRGLYHFSRIRLFFSSPIGLLARRFTRGEPADVKVYPSYAHLSLYSLMCQHRLEQYGIKRIRQVGADTDFEQIKDYVQGDEYRHINWKASARTHSLKVNVYQQDRSMPVYCVVDKGRMMQQSAHGLTFLEYGINAALAISYVALRKDDQAGLISFSANVDTFIPARKQGSQMQQLMEGLYGQKTFFAESDYSALQTHFQQQVNKRSLVLLFANFSTLNALMRELPYLSQIARHHQLLVVIFRDREMEDFLKRQPLNTEDYYQQISVEKYNREKRQIIAQLRLYGILTLYTFPEDLSVNVINRYLEIRRF